MVMASHPSYDEFCIATQEGETAGLYKNSRHIGFKAAWETIIRSHVYELIDGRLFRNSASMNTNEQVTKVAREKTAIMYCHCHVCTATDND